MLQMAPATITLLKDNYFGDRYAFIYLGNYNFNLR